MNLPAARVSTTCTGWGVQEGSGWAGLTYTERKIPTCSSFEPMLATISSKLLTTPGFGFALYTVGYREGKEATSTCISCGCIILLTVGSLKGPFSVSPPASFHLGRPPSKMDTTLCPIVRNTHHTLAAENMPNWSLLS